ncbi:hypothetical protein XENTR_v10013791 [Xenopus tropicalis]|nr:hypothetical protein XENTR_v10013791 [Xenopus tropicalis]
MPSTELCPHNTAALCIAQYGQRTIKNFRSSRGTFKEFISRGCCFQCRVQKGVYHLSLLLPLTCTNINLQCCNVSTSCILHQLYFIVTTLQLKVLFPQYTYTAAPKYSYYFCAVK